MTKKLVPDIDDSLAQPVSLAAAKLKMQPIRLKRGMKTGVSAQFGALCYRIVGDRAQVLLVTSRGSGRWILPKGWPMNGASPARAARREAWEEAGAEGRVTGNALGIYTYDKQVKGARMPCVVAVFPLEVQRLRDRFPEAGARKRRWCTLAEAAAMVRESELRHIILSFDPRSVARRHDMPGA